MNKRGEEYTAINTMELFFIFILATFFMVIIFRGGIDESALNQIKAEDLVSGINSVFLLNNDVNLDYDLGDESYHIEEKNNQLKVYKLNKEKEGSAEIIQPTGFDFTEQVRGKVNKVIIKKQEKGVVIS